MMQKRRPLSPEHKKKLSDAHKGRKLPMEQRLKMSLAHKGKKFTLEHRRNISRVVSGENHPMYGKHHTEEAKRRMSEKLSGENNPMYGTISPMKGRHQSRSAREKIREANTGVNNVMYGKPITSEHRLKLRLARIAFISATRFNYNSFSPSTGKKEEQYLREIELSNQIRLQRGFSCIGYFPDGYHKESNTIIEIDEPYHESRRTQIKDEIRDRELREALQCQIVRISV